MTVRPVLRQSITAKEEDVVRQGSSSQEGQETDGKEPQTRYVFPLGTASDTHPLTRPPNFYS